MQSEPTLAVLFDDCDYSDHQELLYRGLPYTGTVVEPGPQGQILSAQNFKSGILDGVSRGWDSDGTVRSESVYFFGRRTSLREWHANGQLKRDIQYHDGPRTDVIHDFAWDESGQPVDARLLDHRRLVK